SPPPAPDRRWAPRARGGRRSALPGASPACSCPCRRSCGQHLLHPLVPVLEEGGDRIVRLPGQRVTVPPAQTGGGNRLSDAEDQRPAGVNPETTLGGDLVGAGHGHGNERHLRIDGQDGRALLERPELAVGAAGSFGEEEDAGPGADLLDGCLDALAIAVAAGSLDADVAHRLDRSAEDR